jgi:hypothetical protein
MPGLSSRCLAAVFLVSMSCPLFAHHSDSMYDLESLITIRGILTGVSWSNPHVELQVEGENESGERVNFVIEISWPSSLVRNGLSRESFLTGELVEIEGHPSREAGRIAAWGRTVVREDGTVLRLPPKANFTSL